MRRVLSAELLAAPEPYGQQAIDWEVTGQPGTLDHVVLELQVTERPAVEGGHLPLRIVAPRGFLFEDVCSAKELRTEESTPWPGLLGDCHGRGREALIQVPPNLEPLNRYSLRIAVVNPSYQELQNLQRSSSSSLWFLELGEEASPPLVGPRLRLLLDIRVEPTSTAAQGRTAPVALAFVPSSTVPSGGRLRVTAPQGIEFNPSSCLLVESGGACEQCSAVAEALEDLAATNARPSDTEPSLTRPVIME